MFLPNSNQLLFNGKEASQTERARAHATATTIEEAKDILAVGFDYVTEKNGIMLFRRPKRYAG